MGSIQKLCQRFTLLFSIRMTFSPRARSDDQNPKALGAVLTHRPTQGAGGIIGWIHKRANWGVLEKELPSRYESMFHDPC